MMSHPPPFLPGRPSSSALLLWMVAISPTCYFCCMMITVGLVGGGGWTDRGGGCSYKLPRDSSWTDHHVRSATRGRRGRESLGKMLARNSRFQQCCHPPFPRPPPLLHSHMQLLTVRSFGPLCPSSTSSSSPWPRIYSRIYLHHDTKRRPR